MLIQLVVLILVLGVAFWAVGQLSAAFSIPAPIVVVIQVLLVIVGLGMVLHLFGLDGGFLSISSLNSPRG